MLKDEIADAFVALAKPGTSAKELKREIETAFPRASKKQLRLAAYAAMITLAERNDDAAAELQGYAIAEGPADRG
jgi:hypothetical protein